MPLAMGLAFVAFTTQFGGGFASGAQIYQPAPVPCLAAPIKGLARDKEQHAKRASVTRGRAVQVGHHQRRLGLRG